MYFGFNNFGDEAILKSAIDIIKNNTKDKYIYCDQMVIPHVPEDIPGTWCICLGTPD